jgi:hypothetical protein
MLFEQCWTVICWVASVTVISIHDRWFSLPVHRTQPEITKATGFRPGFSLLVRDVSQPLREVRELETRSHGVGSVFSQPMRDVSAPETRSSRLGFEFFAVVRDVTLVLHRTPRPPALAWQSWPGAQRLDHRVTHIDRRDHLPLW